MKNIIEQVTNISLNRRIDLRKLLSYPSVVTSNVNNVPIGIIYHSVQILIVGYIIGYELIYKKGYQITEETMGTTAVKAKGFGLEPKNNNYSVDQIFDVSIENGVLDEKQFNIYDSTDYVIPPNEYNSMFIMTSKVQTEQTQGTCEEDFMNTKARCQTDSDCLNAYANNWNGIPTGRCLNSTRFEGLKLCEVNSWCPVEVENQNETNIIQNSFTYTIFIRATVEFRRFRKKEHNIRPNINGEYIARCAFDKPKSPACPVFTVREIVKSIEPNEQDHVKVLRKGAIILMRIHWDCNYDWRSSCMPQYSFERFDYSLKESKSVSGFNFRYAEKYMKNNQTHRMLNKAYGLRILMTVTGKGGKFNALQLLLTIGACLGLLSISSLIAEILTWTFAFKNSQVYQNFLREKSMSQRRSATSCYNVYQTESQMRSSLTVIDDVDLNQINRTSETGKATWTNQIYTTVFPISDENSENFMKNICSTEKNQEAKELRLNRMPLKPFRKRKKYTYRL